MTTAQATIVWLSVVAAVPWPSATGQELNPAVAIVSAVSGTASVTVPPDHKPTPLRLFEWLPAGSVIDVPPGSTVTVVFANGARYQLGETAKATAATNALISTSGPVRQLTDIPPLPRVSPIAHSARPGPRSGAVRIRGATITHLYPDSGSTALAESTVLRFTPLPDASRYRLNVETENGTSVFQAETQSATVMIPPGILKAGANYHWHVRTLDRIGQVARGAAEFVTLSAETARERAALKESLTAAGDVPSLALLAEIDRRLGLLVEACEGFRAVLARAPGDKAFEQALDRLEQQLFGRRGQK